MIKNYILISHTKIAHRFIGALLCIASSFQLYAAEDRLSNVLSENSVGSTVYVLVSRASLYADANAKAKILARPVTNTPVKLLAMKGDWCEVELLPPTNEASRAITSESVKDQRGHMDCRQLTPEPLTLAGAEAQIANSADKITLLEWTARAFWIAPSLGRWAKTGRALENAQLDAETRNREISGGKPLRFKVSDFDAITQRLAKGVLVYPPTYKPGMRWAVDDPALQYMHFKSALGRVRLPASKLSFFSSGTAPVMLPVGSYGSLDYGRAIELIDSLSATNLIPFKAVVTAPASYVLNPDTPLYAEDTHWRFIKVAGAMDEIVGIWDVGGLNITFDKTVFLHGVTANGEPAEKGISAIKLDIGYDSSCSYSPSHVEMVDVPVKGYPNAHNALLMWAGKPMPGDAKSKAVIKSRRFEGETEYDLVVTHEIDLDRDGVPDFVIWQGRYQPQVSAEGLWQTTFANIDGQWFMVDYQEDSDCT